VNVPTRLAAFAAALGLAFGGAALAGAAIDPTDEESAVAAGGHGDGETASAGEGSPGGDHGSSWLTARTGSRSSPPGRTSKAPGRSGSASGSWTTVGA
jgi:hypothetical protein